MRGSRRRRVLVGLTALALVGGLLGSDPLPVTAAPAAPPAASDSPQPRPPSTDQQLAQRQPTSPAPTSPAPTSPAPTDPSRGAKTLAATAVDAPAVGGPGEYQYDAAGRLVGVVQNATQAARYSYDPAGNVTGVTRYAATQLAVVSVVPASVRPGGSVTVRGTGFPASGAVVKFNGTTGAVTSATATSLTVTVPSGVTAGPLTVTSGTTTVTGPSYAVAAPGPTVTAVSPTTGPPGTVVTVTGTGFRTEPADNVVSFNGIRAEVVGVTATSMTVAVPLTASSGRVEVATPAGSTRWSGDFTVPPAGVDPALIESSRRIDVGSAPVTVPVSAGKVALVLFDAPAPKRINLGFGAITFTNYVDADLYDSKGRKLKSAYGSSPFQLDADNLTAGATYQLVLDPSGTTSGQLAVSVSEPQTASLSTTAAGAAITFNRIGQDFAGTVSAQSGQRLSIGIAPSTMTSYSNLSVLRPDGTALVDDDYVSGVDSVRFTADVSGTYVVVVDPAVTSTGSMTVTASLQIAAGALTATGGGVAASLGRPGQTAAWTFAGTAGQSANLGLTSNTLTSAAYVQVLAPDGSGYVKNEYVSGQASASVPMDTLPATGTYTVLVEPLGAATGAVTLTYSTQVNAGALTVTGASTPVTIGRAGQAARATFAATVGQPMTLAVSANTLTKYAYADVYAPDGTRLVSEYVSSASDGVARFTAKVTGTHTLRIRPSGGATGSFGLTLSTRAAAGTLSTTGAGTTATAARAGQDVALTLTAAVGQNLSVGLTANTFPKPVYAYLYGPDGTKVSGFAEYLSAGADATTRLPAITTAGTYTLVLEAQYAVTGALTVTLSNDVAAGALTAGGAAKPITFSRPGQASRLTFSGTSGQTVKLNYSGLASGYYAEGWVYPPTGAAIVNGSFLSGSGTITVPALTATGTYQVVLAPYRPSAGSMSVSLVNAPAANRADQSPTSARQQQATEKAAQARPVRRPSSRPATSAAQWRPDRTNLRGQDWVTRRPAAPSVKNLRAPTGATAVTGHVLTLDGKPLAAVTVKAGEAMTKTDRRGRFLLRGVSPATKTVIVDGASASRPEARYGLFRIRVEVREGRTTALPATVWMPRLDTRHLVRVGAPTVGETVLTTPEIPGLEVRIPAGSVIRDLDGEVVTELGITPIPLDRPPYPLPTNGIVPVFFTVQPGGAAVFPKGAQVIYPNYTKLPPGQVVDFYNYDPEGKGWYVYGHGKVSEDATQVVPDADTRVWRFDGAMFNTGSLPSWLTSRFKDFVDWVSGDPVDLSTGLLVDHRTDLAVDDVMPIQVSRTLWQGDTSPREFGIGQIADYGMFLHSEKQYEQVDLYVPGGAKIHYVRTSPGTGYSDAEFAVTGTTSEFEGSTIKWYSPVSGWQLTLSDGTRWRFPMYSRATSILDRNGNEITLTRGASNGDLTQITSPSGRWIKLGYDSAGRVTSARDNVSRSVSYTYDATGRLSTVKDVAGRVSTYTYDAAGRILTIKDGRGVVYLTNVYDANGRVAKQTLPGGAVFTFAYTLSGTAVTETRVTQPNGSVRRMVFNAAGAAVSETAAYGTTLSRTTTYSRGSDQRLTAVTDPFGRRTAFGYDSVGRLTTVKELAGTPDEVTTQTSTYGAYDQPLTATDAAGKTTRFGYDSTGNLTSSTDPEGRVVRFTRTTDGQVASTTTSDGRVSTFGYRLGDLVSVTDPLGRRSSQFVDGAGRTVAAADPAGNTSTVTYNAQNEPTRATDPLGQTTTFSYDENGNLTRLTDPRLKALSWTYDAADRVSSATDQVGKVTTYGYDAAGRQIASTSRAGRKTTIAYDALDRPTTVAYGVTAGSSESTATFGYDAYDRPRTKTDSAGGTLTLGYDVRDRLTSLTQPRGVVTYAWDTVGRQTTATVAGQATTYGYDSTGLTRSVASGAATTTINYTSAGQPATTTLPGGWTETNTWDAAGQLTGIAYAKGGTAKGSLGYTYDATGRVRTVTGSMANVQLPTARSGLSYNDANRLVSAGGSTLSYDADGNLTNDGTAVYTWNARNELTKVSKTGLTASFAYDAMGARASRTVNGAVTGFLDDGMNTSAELDAGNAVTARLTSGGVDQWFSRTKGGVTDALLTDRQGSPVALGAADGTLTARSGYDPFGAATTSGDRRGSDLSYTGRQDDGTGLMYYRDRYYSPSLQRFISEDPSGIAGGVNLYGYAANDPTNLTDPTGNNPLLVGCAVGAVTDGAISYVSQRLSGRKVDWGWNGVGGSLATGCAFGMLGGLGEGLGAARSLSKVCNCFPAGTTVQTDEGAKPIEDIRVGDQVWAKDLDSGTPELRRVTGLFDKPADELVDLVVDSVRFQVTPDHPFWVQGEGWTEASDLESGDQLADRSGRGATVESVRVHVASTTVYNFSVEGDENYYVSAAQLLVHNCTLPRNALGQFASGSGGESVAASVGRRAHLSYENALGGGNYVFNSRLKGSLMRPDAVDYTNRVVRELKPANAKAVARGWRQVNGYKAYLERTTGQTWTAIVDVYKP